MYYLYTTGQGNIYPIEFSYKFLKTTNIIYNYKKITGLCNSCNNFNNSGGCPPLAPKFAEVAGKKQYSIIICAKLKSKYKTEKVKKSNNYYIHYRSQDVILSHLLTNLGYEIRDSYKNKYSILFLNNGYCMGCSSKCNFKKGENYCLNPKRRTYSLEATGVNVEKTLKEQFNVKLQWYNRENYREVDYMVKVIGFFYNNKSLHNIIRDNFISHLNNLKFTKYRIGSKDFIKKLSNLK